MIRQLPLIPTIIVVAAASVMVALGFWQLGRADEKAAMIAEFEAAQEQGSFTSTPGASTLYHEAELTCSQVVGRTAISGRNANGRNGYVHVVQCTAPLALMPDEIVYDVVDEGPYDAEIVLGWSQGPQSPEWEPDTVRGVIAPGGELGWRLVADPPQAGLLANARPDPNDLPNNHLAYAGQWFFFAMTALVIYFFAVRSKLARRD
ncbi:SURF1 family protein [Erythrobacter sp. SCSIO 43205]|uniref:SURF1 family cytochrome oxidase biogenesis protein n=1 Tax=Erythrobacter sp. SCSIO 43205 TaxID=2779361 RepID=UPI001CA9C082|nr:SURF1 family cytochrome oxidase biogenesis protein [Erythrobacter sp. SCSIO 43205]UAB79505.1 SURF1 family protein [Erythrobacter sp. SCSIO 43205]